jgi:hypothetical protein
MSRRTLRRATLSLLVISFSMLPLSSAHAAPASRNENGASVVRMMDLSRIVKRSMADLLRLLTGADAPPPGLEGTNNGREGTGIDPHGHP